MAGWLACLLACLLASVQLTLQGACPLVVWCCWICHAGYLFWAHPHHGAPLLPQVTFPAPVVLTTARIGAVPSSSDQQQRTQLLLFAQDAGAPASARFLQLCPGFEQPESSTRVVQLQVRGQGAGYKGLRWGVRGACGPRGQPSSC